MKLAVLNSTGIQSTAQGIIDNYFLVTDTYDFNANASTDVTDYNAALLLSNALKMDYVGARECMKTKYKVQEVWDSLSDEDKEFLISQCVYPDGADLSAYSTEQLDNFQRIMLTMYLGGRFHRKEILRALIFRFYKTSVSIQYDIQSSIKQMSVDYIESGFPELQCWLSGATSPVTNINYSSVGYPSKSYYDSSFQTQALNIIANGIY